MSVPITQRNFQRTEEAPQMDFSFSPFKGDFKDEVVRMLVAGPVKRNYKKMDGRMRILKQI